MPLGRWAMADSLRVITNEHRNLYRIVHLLESLVRDRLEGRTDPAAVAATAAASGPDGGPAPDPGLAVMAGILDYLETFMDRFHHPKEDRHLFARLRARDPEAGRILDDLEREHARCPVSLVDLRRGLERCRAGEAGAEDTFLEAARAYLRFQTEHLQKEDAIVLPLARRCLTAEDWAEIDAAFATNDDPIFGHAARVENRDLYLQLVRLAPAPHGLGA